jgi:hypothetical protein
MKIIRVLVYECPSSPEPEAKMRRDLHMRGIKGRRIVRPGFDESGDLTITEHFVNAERVHAWLDEKTVHEADVRAALQAVDRGV